MAQGSSSSSEKTGDARQRSSSQARHTNARPYRRRSSSRAVMTHAATRSESLASSSSSDRECEGAGGGRHRAHKRKSRARAIRSKLLNDEHLFFDLAKRHRRRSGRRQREESGDSDSDEDDSSSASDSARSSTSSGSGASDGSESEKPLLSQPEKDEERRQQRRSRTRRWLTLSLGVFFLCALGLLVYFLYTRLAAGTTGGEEISTQDAAAESSASASGSLVPATTSAEEDEGTMSTDTADDASDELTALPTSTSGDDSSSKSSNGRSSSTSTSSSAASSATTGGGGKGLFGVTDSTCGDSGATDDSTPEAGPNGAASWLTCGISKSDQSSKWTPPKVTVDELAYVDLSNALDGYFKPCTDYVDKFNTIAIDLGLPPILLASIAMTESTCNPQAYGNAYGLMQITEDKCGSAPNGDCYDVDYNIKTGAEYLLGQLKTYDDNILLALGTYNGWTESLTYSQATAAASSDCCECQNNLDYLHSILNGNLQGIDGLSLTTFKNLAVCSGG